MRSVIEPAEFQAADSSADFKKRFGEVLGGVGLPVLAAFTDVRVAGSNVADRLWNLGRLVFGAHATPDSAWAELPPFLDLWSPSHDEAALREKLKACKVAPESTVVIAIDDAHCPEAIAAPWAVCCEHVLPGNLMSIVMPPDASWMLVSYHGEFVRGCRTRFGDVRSITFRPHYERHDGLLVPKPCYEVLFADGRVWKSGDLRRVPTKHLFLDSSLATVAALAGTSIERKE